MKLLVGKPIEFFNGDGGGGGGGVFYIRLVTVIWSVQLSVGVMRCLAEKIPKRTKFADSVIYFDF
jgi:hypothetical protein